MVYGRQLARKGFAIGYLNGVYIFFLLSGPAREYMFAADNKGALMQALQNLFSKEPSFVAHFKMPYEELISDCELFVQAYKEGE